MKSQKRLLTRKNKEIIITTSWDDFSEFDYKLIELLKEFAIPAIFYIPYKELLKKEKLEYAKEIMKDFEIGSHTINHPQDLKLISDEDLIDEISGSKDLIEEALNTKVSSFCYPRGRFNSRVVKAVKNAGYETARTVTVGNTSLMCDPLKIATTVHAYSGRKEYKNYSSWVDYALIKLDYVMACGGYFHLWGHSAEIQKHGDWVNLEWFLSYLNKTIYD